MSISAEQHTAASIATEANRSWIEQRWAQALAVEIRALARYHALAEDADRADAQINAAWLLWWRASCDRRHVEQQIDAEETF